MIEQVSKPGTTLRLEAIPDFTQRLLFPVLPGRDNYLKIRGFRFDEVIEAAEGYQVTVDRDRLRVRAPHGEAWGYTRIRSGERELTLTVINLIPYDQVRNGLLRGYKIGNYREQPLRGLPTYELPTGFFALSPEMENVWISDRYRLRDFQCKLEGETKVLIVRPEALLKLELLQNKLERDHGLKFTRFSIMSGYRTPYYNQRIGNRTVYSRHLYGDGMDIYVDESGNSFMDDLNGDGRIDREDAMMLLRAAEAIDNSPQWGWLKGGAGIYPMNRIHGPYVHIDTRGYIARWGV
jgi:hypothetical protein